MVKKGDAKGGKRCIESGTKIDMYNVNKETPMMVAQKNLDTSTVKLVVEHGADNYLNYFDVTPGFKNIDEIDGIISRAIKDQALEAVPKTSQEELKKFTLYGMKKTLNVQKRFKFFFANYRKNPKTSAIPPL